MSSEAVGTCISVVILYVVQSLAYRLFEHLVPSRRDNPPIAEFGLVPIESDSGPAVKEGSGLDVIFVHGLGSHPDSTWRAEKGLEALPSQKGSQRQQKEYVYWVKDYLIPDLASKGRCHLRLFYYNYDSAYYRDASDKRLQDLGDQLLAGISSRRQSAQLVRCSCCDIDRWMAYST